MVRVGDLYFDLTNDELRTTSLVDTTEIRMFDAKHGKQIGTLTDVQSNSRASPLLTNCPNCGAPVNPTSHKCEYCDTPYRQNRNYEMELLIAKNKALNSSIEMRTLYEEALRAMRRYCD